MWRNLAIGVVLAGVLASCGVGGGSGGSSEGDGTWYHLAYNTCLHIVNQRPLPMRKIANFDHLIFHSNGGKQKALENGCKAGSIKGGGAFSSIVGTSDTVTP